MTNLINSLYLHVPFCKHLCNYCDFYKMPFHQNENFESFHYYLRNSWNKLEKLHAENNYEFGELQTFYMGGGTPSLWGERGADFFSQFFKQKLAFAPNCEITMELDPGAWDEKSFQLWKQAGVNRVSIGVQSFDPNGLKFLDRSHNYQNVVETLGYFSQAKINFSVDFMIGLGLPDKNRNIVKELERILAYHPNHISLYILTVGDHYPLKKFIPEDEVISNEYQLVDEFLSSQGFHHYEVSNYAKPGFESKHNQQYWSQNSVAGIGPSASGLMKKDATKAMRYKWIPGKVEMISEELNLEQVWLERIYLILRTSKSWKLQEILPSLDQAQKYEKILESWSSQGLVSRDKGTYQMNAKSWIILDSLVQQLL